MNSEVVLTIDRGNSTLDCQRIEGGATTRRRLSPDDAAGLEALLDPPPAAAVACTVIPDGLRCASAVLAEHDVRLMVAGLDLPCPLDLRYPNPETLGPDRWLAAWAAYREFGASVVVDCGTAVTVDIVTGTGVFLGGAIAPGAATLARGLSDAVPSLPTPDPARPVSGVPVMELPFS